MGSGIGIGWQGVCGLLLAMRRSALADLRNRTRDLICALSCGLSFSSLSLVRRRLRICLWAVRFLNISLILGSVDSWRGCGETHLTVNVSSLRRDNISSNPNSPLDRQKYSLVSFFCFERLQCVFGLPAQGDF